MIDYEDFLKLDIRAGSVVNAKPFPKARKPAYQLKIDFGDEIGMLQSSVQITQLYECDDLVGKTVCAVVNFPEKQIANFMSQCLVLGFYTADGVVSLISPDHQIENGAKLC